MSVTYNTIPIPIFIITLVNERLAIIYIKCKTIISVFTGTYSSIRGGKVLLLT